jgi:hypothetical protein
MVLCRSLLPGNSVHISAELSCRESLTLSVMMSAGGGKVSPAAA